MIKNAKFLISVATGCPLPSVTAPEIAIAGKSNVGKSSFINFLTSNGKLAKTSSEPGRTRLVNFFEINNGEYYFVDLPGYGFAKAPKGEKAKWGELIEGYLQSSPNLRHVFLLLDVRLIPSEDDKMLINYFYHYNIDFTIIATKCDKLSRLQMNKMRQAIASECGIGVENVLLTSSSAKIGKDDVLARIDQIVA